jgi:hypothetical protein
MDRPGTARNSNGSGRPEIQTIRAWAGLGRAAQMYTYTSGRPPPSDAPLPPSGKLLSSAVVLSAPSGALLCSSSSSALPQFIC